MILPWYFLSTLTCTFANTSAVFLRHFLGTFAGLPHYFHDISTSTSTGSSASTSTSASATFARSRSAMLGHIALAANNSEACFVLAASKTFRLFSVSFYLVNLHLQSDVIHYIYNAHWYEKRYFVAFSKGKTCSKLYCIAK